jgi:CDP-glucose 4,6-dehydratase
VTAAYRDSFFADGAAIASVRAGNVIGGGDWAPDRIIPDSVRALVAGEPVVVRNPDAVRPWQHVLEPLSGYLRLGALLLRDGRRYAGPWNFGPTDDAGERPVRWVVERFLAEWGSGSWTTPPNLGRQPHEALRLSLDSAKSREQLGWAPVWDGEEAVRRTAAWYREYDRDPAAARDLVDEQLRAYQDDARAAGLPWAAATAAEEPVR